MKSVRRDFVVVFGAAALHSKKAKKKVSFFSPPDFLLEILVMMLRGDQNWKKSATVEHGYTKISKKIVIHFPATIQ